MGVARSQVIGWVWAHLNPPLRFVNCISVCVPSRFVCGLLLHDPSYFLLGLLNMQWNGGSAPVLSSPCADRCDQMCYTSWSDTSEQNDTRACSRQKLCICFEIWSCMSPGPCSQAPPHQSSTPHTGAALQRQCTAPGLACCALVTSLPLPACATTKHPATAVSAHVAPPNT